VKDLSDAHALRVTFGMGDQMCERVDFAVRRTRSGAEPRETGGQGRSGERHDKWGTAAERVRICTCALTFVAPDRSIRAAAGRVLINHFWPKRKIRRLHFDTLRGFPMDHGSKESCANFKPLAIRRVYRIMAKNPREGLKMELHGKGVGGFSEQDIDRRAKELALIDGRTTSTDEDRNRAVAEFRDADLPDAVNEDADSMQSMSRDPSDPLTDRGRQVPTYGGEDEKTMLEHLALEGVEEAQHEQMLQSRNDIDEPLRSRPRLSKDQ
jgi:hypothetical protein